MAHDHIPEIGEALTNLPDGKKLNIQPKDTSKGHFYVSLVKSFIRVAAGTAFIFSAIEPFYAEHFIITAGALLIGAEILGVVEELV